MWEYLGDQRSTDGSGADACKYRHCIQSKVFLLTDTDFTTATVNRKQGWFTLGQYGVNTGWSPGGSKGLLIRNVPGSQSQLIRQPDGFQRAWGKSSSYGLYEMTNSNPNYYALSGLYYGADSIPFSQLETDRVAMVHLNLTVLASNGGQIWNDGGSGARDDANVERVYYGSPDDDSVRIIQAPDGAPEAYFFHTNGFYMNPPLRLDFSKVQFVSNNFVNSA